jgi:hypothetical protein
VGYAFERARPVALLHSLGSGPFVRRIIGTQRVRPMVRGLPLLRSSSLVTRTN